MKIQLKKYFRLPILLTLIVGMSFAACSDVADSNKEDNVILSEEIEIGADAQAYTNSVSAIYYGRNRTSVGRVSYSKEGDSIEFTFETEEDWPLSEIHIWVGNDQNGYPQSGRSGIPKIGHFPYNSDKDKNFDPKLNSEEMWEYTVTYSTEGSGRFQATNLSTKTYMIIHTVVGNDETAFAGCWDSDSDPNVKSPRWFNWIEWYADWDFRVCPGSYNEADATP